MLAQAQHTSRSHDLLRCNEHMSGLQLHDPGQLYAAVMKQEHEAGG